MRRLVLAALFALMLILPCSAETYGAEAVADSLPEAARDVMGDMTLSDALDTEGLLERLWRAAAEKLRDVWRGAAAPALGVVCVALLCSFANAAGERGTERYALLGGALAVAVIAVGDAGSCLTAKSEALSTLSDFSRALLPCLASAAAAGGALTSAAAKYAATALFMDIFITAAQSLILPMLYVYLAVNVAAAGLESAALRSAASLLKWLCAALMTLLVGAFTGYLAISGAVSSAADAVTAKAAKAAISAALPVVGGIVSNAAGAVVAGAGLVRNSVGVLGLLAVLSVILGPFIALGARYLLYKAASVLARSLAPDGLGDLVSAVGTAFGMALALVGSAALMLFISVISLMKAVAV